jgi:hypothetical protein
MVNFDGNRFLSLPEFNTSVWNSSLYNTNILETEWYDRTEAVIQYYHCVDTSLILSVINDDNPLFVQGLLMPTCIWFKHLIIIPPQ